MASLSDIVGASRSGGGGQGASKAAPPILIAGIDIGRIDDFAVPAEIGFGGEQRVPKLELLGGGRAVQSTGAYPDDTSWSGRFGGGGAYQNAMKLDALRMAGAPVALACRDVNLTVVVSSFRWRYVQYWVLYQITVVVVPDPPAQPAETGPAALQTATQTDMKQSGGILATITSATGTIISTAQAGVAAVTTVLNTVQSGIAAAQKVLGVAGALLGSKAVSGLQNTLAGVSSGISNAESLAEQGINAANTLQDAAFNGPGALADQAVTMIANVTGYSGQLAAAKQAEGFVARSLSNLAAAAPNAAATPTPNQPGSVATLPGG